MKKMKMLSKKIFMIAVVVVLMTVVCSCGGDKSKKNKNANNTVNKKDMDIVEEELTEEGESFSITAEEPVFLK